MRLVTYEVEHKGRLESYLHLLNRGKKSGWIVLV